MTEDRRRALDADRTIGRMYADPDLRGDLLAVGLALLRLLREGEAEIGLSRVAEMVGWRHPGGHPNWLRVKYVLSDDRPRYVPRQDAETCLAPMQRRAGPCGTRTSQGQWGRDPDGEMVWLAACPRHHDWAREESQRAWARWARSGGRQPPANTGGVLARYIDLDWGTIYRWGDAGWFMPRGGPPKPEARPRLTLVVGEGEDGVVPDRDALSAAE